MPGDAGRRNKGRAAPGDDHGPWRQATARNQHQKSPENTPGGTAHPATTKLDVLREDGKAWPVRGYTLLLGFLALCIRCHRIKLRPAESLNDI